MTKKLINKRHGAFSSNNDNIEDVKLWFHQFQTGICLSVP